MPFFLHKHRIISIKPVNCVGLLRHACQGDPSFLLIESTSNFVRIQANAFFQGESTRGGEAPLYGQLATKSLPEQNRKFHPRQGPMIILLWMIKKGGRTEIQGWEVFSIAALLNSPANQFKQINQNAIFLFEFY